MTEPRLAPPKRFRRPSLIAWLALTVLVVLLVDAWNRGIRLDITEGHSALRNLASFLSNAWPPDLGRFVPILLSLLQTLEMALVGTLLGASVSLPIGLAAARNMTPHLGMYYAARLVISVSRTVPDLVWGLIFVIAVGLGPEAGILALAVDAVGFCGRFFAEAFEEMDPGPTLALKASGCGPFAQVVGGVLPSTLPSLITTSMFSLEQATRSAVVLGVVGAGGIGIELTVSMTLLRYDEALTIILCIFGVVWSVERIAAMLRRKVMVGGAGDLSF